MNSRPFAATRRTVAWRAVVAALAASLSLPALSAERSALLKVSDAQMQAMGITAQPLQTAGASVAASFPALVVVPPGGERIVSAPLTTLVEQVFVQPGQAVKSGAPLLRIASAELGQAQMQLAQAAVRARLAQQTLAREQSLFGEGIIPERRVQEARAALTQAQAEVGQARSTLRLIGMPQAAMDKVAGGGQAQDGLTLSAQQAGTVTEIAVRPGQRVEASSLLLRLVQSGAIGLEIQVPAAQASAYPMGTKLKVVGTNTPAHVVSSSPNVAPGSQTSTLRAAVDDRGVAVTLRPGEAVTVQMGAPQSPASGTAPADTWTIPLPAVAYDGQKAHVFVKTAQGFEARPVQVLNSAGQQVRVQGALKAGDSVAVSGVVALKGAWLKEAP